LSTLALIAHVEEVYAEDRVEQVRKFNRDELEAMVLYLVGERQSTVEHLRDLLARFDSTSAELLALIDRIHPEEAASG